MSLEMSISREEFLRLLPGAVGPGAVDGEGAFHHADGTRRWTIRLLPLGDRRLGNVVLPRHRVEIHLEGHSEEEADRFMTRFLRGFQRGGG